MAMSSRQRWALIMAALLATLGAMAWLETTEETAGENTQAEPSALASSGQQAPVHRGRSEQARAADVQGSKGSEGRSADVRQDVVTVASTLLPDLTLRKQTLAADDEQHVDLFKAHAWYVPPPPPPPKPTILPENLPPPKPVAPPLPYTYMGKLEDGPQGSLIFLVQRDKVVQAMLGQTLDRVWKLEREDANTLHFTYLPLSMTKSLSKAAKSAASAGTAPQNRMPAVAPAPPMPDGTVFPTEFAPSEPPIMPTN